MTEAERQLKVRITNIQRFSLHDGPGIRTTVFLKGCSLHCPWCANPENIRYEIEPWQKSDGTFGVFGRDISLAELYEELLKDHEFYLNSGGVTFSGGEPLLQAELLEPLWRELKILGIHQCIETCLFVSVESLNSALQHIDLFYVDIKILDRKRCQEIISGNLKQYISNLEALFNSRKQVIFRIPVIGGYTDDDVNRRYIIDLLRQYKPHLVELMKEHNLGQSKYISLGRTPLELHSVTNVFMEQYKREIEESVDIKAVICNA